MMCSWCNSRFHLVRDFPDRVQLNSNHFNGDDNSDAVVDEHYSDDTDQALSIEISTVEYSHNQSEYTV